MGEDPLAETRLAISAQRAEMERTADQLRDALDIQEALPGEPGAVRRARRRRRLPRGRRPGARREARPAPPLPLGSGEGVRRPAEADAVLGRPHGRRGRTARGRGARRRSPRSSSAGATTRASTARSARSSRSRSPRARPDRSERRGQAFEAGAAILTAALARKAVERFLSGEPPLGHRAARRRRHGGRRRRARSAPRQGRRHRQLPARRASTRVARRAELLRRCTHPRTRPELARGGQPGIGALVDSAPARRTSRSGRVAERQTRRL